MVQPVQRLHNAWVFAAVGALPLAMAGMLPLWTLLILCAVFAATVPRPQFRMTLSLLVLSVSLLLSLWSAAQQGDTAYLIASFSIFVGQGAMLYLLAQAAERATDLEGGTWLWVLPAVLLAPHPAALVGLGAAALLSAPTDFRLLGEGWQGERRALPLLVTAGLLTLWVAGALPRSSPWQAWVQQMGQSTVIVDQSVSKPSVSYRGSSPPP
ncbi:hypothetical protein ACFP81_13445 [Deinococcus lacus]|uniref:Uncharacterized protein n=1 Tax=Deinococcus lacus TaxID=392561 RepID=A0ABW1YID0_9DEIO